MKSFIFSQVPSEWDFSTDEKLHGMLQIIDITEDNTGEPHKLARNELPMYGKCCRRAAAEILAATYEKLRTCFRFSDILVVYESCRTDTYFAPFSSSALLTQ